MSFLKNSITRLHEYKRLADKAMAQLSDECLLRGTEGENNSIVVIVKHVSGNMLSRWTNFLTEDGEKPWRQRDDEFIHEALTRERLLQMWEEGWACVFHTLNALTEDDLLRTIHIRQEPLSAMDAIIRQLMHYAYHVGQISLICKQESGEGWQSLSIPRGQSAAYNTAMAQNQDMKKNPV